MAKEKEELVDLLIVTPVWGYDRSRYLVPASLPARLVKTGEDYDDEAWNELWECEQTKGETDIEGDNGDPELFVARGDGEWDEIR